MMLSRDACINCASCVPEDNERFVENERGEVHLRGIDAKIGGNEEVVLEVQEAASAQVSSAVEICPTGAISVSLIS